MGDDRDNTTITASSFANNPRRIAIIVFCYICLTIFRMFLAAMIKINSATVHNFEFHCRATELLHYTRLLLSMK